MATKLIDVPLKTFDLLSAEGRPTGEVRNTFAHLLGLLVETTPQKSDTDAFLAHSIRTKLDDLTETLKPTLQPVNGEQEPQEQSFEPFELEESEIQFLRGGLDHLRKNERMTGTGWYWLISALNEAKMKDRKAETK